MADFQLNKTWTAIQAWIDRLWDGVSVSQAEKIHETQDGGAGGVTDTGINRAADNDHPQYGTGHAFSTLPSLQNPIRSTQPLQVHLVVNHTHEDYITGFTETDPGIAAASGNCQHLQGTA